MLPTIRQAAVRDAAALLCVVLDVSEDVFGTCVQLTLHTDDSLRSRSTSTAGCRAACPTIILPANFPVSATEAWLPAGCSQPYLPSHKMPSFTREAS